MWRENDYLSFPFDLERVPFFPLLELALYCLDVGKEIPDILGNDAMNRRSRKKVNKLYLLRLGPLVSGKRRMQNIGVRGAFDTECAVIGFTGSQASEGLRRSEPMDGKRPFLEDLLDFGAFFYHCANVR